MAMILFKFLFNFYTSFESSAINTRNRMLFTFSIMTKNRRFPFERTGEPIVLDGFAPTDQPLYPTIREYASIGRQTARKRSPETPTTSVPSQDPHRFHEFLHYLKQQQQQRANDAVDANDFSSLRAQNLQQWKDVKQQWQKYYHDGIKQERAMFDHLMSTLNR